MEGKDNFCKFKREGRRGGGGKPGQLHCVISGVYTAASVGDSLLLFTPNHMSPDRPNDATASNIVMARRNACTRDLVLQVHLSPPLTPTPSTTPCEPQHTHTHSVSFRQNVFQCVLGGLLVYQVLFILTNKSTICQHLSGFA